ncbi:MAG TPA: VWA domain-containing protein [Polyangiaceae bacterium]|nr:VWA domain-containing protein [Polyangiaceae bacterium]
MAQLPPEVDGLSALGTLIQLSRPLALWALVVLPLVIWWATRSLAELPTWLRAVSAACRTAFVVCLTLALALPSAERESRRVCVVALLDVSESVSDDSLAGAHDYVRRLGEALEQQGESSGSGPFGPSQAAGEPRDGEGALRVVVFGAEARTLGWRLGDAWPSSSELRAGSGSGSTDLERALQHAAALRGEGCSSRVVLLSDGIATRGDALSAAAELGRSARLSTVPWAGSGVRDAAVVDVRLPGEIELGAPFEVGVQLRSSEVTPARLVLYQGAPGEPESRPVLTREIELAKGVSWLGLPSVVRRAGPTEFRVELEQASPDHFPANDTQTATIDVPGPPRVLLIDGQPADARYLADALSAQRFEVEVRGAAASPTSAAELRPFRFVVLSDVSRSALSRTSERALVDFVRGGGGLLYAGGAAGYGPGGWQGSELAGLLPVTIEDRKTRETPSVALALVIDRSGSMTGLPLALAKRACASTLEVLAPDDLLEVIAFDAKPTRYVKMQPARYRGRIEQEILRIQPGGGTEIFPALDAAFQDLAGSDARRKHVILLTDGNASSEGLHDLVSSAFADGIGVTAVGLGAGVNEELLRSIAEAGGGRFHHAPEPSQLPRIFTRETEFLTQPVEAEEWFPMQAVGHAEALAGLDWSRAPHLRGMAHLRMKPAPAEALLVADTGEPLLGRTRVGLGQLLAWTSDLKAHWAIDLLRWRDFGKLMAQLVRAHRATDDERKLPMQTELIGDALRVWVDAYDAAEHFENGLVSTLRVDGPGLSAREFPLPLVSPGRYEARLNLPGFGAYSLVGDHRRPTTDGALGAFATSRSSVARAYPDEFRRLDPDPELLRRLALLGRGEFAPQPAQVADPGQDVTRERVDRQAPLLWCALGLLLADLAARRLWWPSRRSA